MYMYCEGQISCVMAAVMKLFFVVTALAVAGASRPTAARLPRCTRSGVSLSTMCAGERPTYAAPLVTRETLERVRAELWQQQVKESPVEEQQKLISKLLSPLEAVLEQQQRSSDKAPLNEVLAPHLPVLLGRSFPLAARGVLSTIRTQGERAALLALSEYVTDAQREIADALEELQWRQQQKLRELCDAATDGGTERVLELAQAMKAELDTDFCNYLNMAIEQEETRLKAAGMRPFVPPSIVGGRVPAALLAEERQAQAQAAAASRALTGSDEGDTDGDASSGPQWQEIVNGAVRPWGVLKLPAKATPNTTPSLAAAVAAAAATPTPPLAAAKEDEWADDEDEDKALDEERGEEAEKTARDPRGAGAGWRIEERPPPSWLQDGVPQQPQQPQPQQAAAAAAAAPSASSSLDDDGPAAVAREVQEQQWLLVLRLVRQGIYAMLAKDYVDDVKHLRYIVGLNSAQARLELTHSTMLAMSAEQQAKFARTVERITANLSVQRDARDLELYSKTKEVQAHIQGYGRSFGGASGQSEWDPIS